MNRKPRGDETTIRPGFALILFGGISLLFWYWFVEVVTGSQLNHESLATACSIACWAGTLSYFALRGLIKNRKSATDGVSGSFCTYLSICMALLALYLGYSYSPLHPLGPGFAAVVFSFGSPILRKIWLLS
ncbi:MAG: hypothetical protein JAY94_19315 [Candidatus Thiodiazotropha endolucinida]|nr:hypothetical protein [Candidatus Thiodiazotropha taylori]MCW4319669.1 hypothetical protein [Candidatus Thiodiazotropha taylori]